ncbi:MAG TPA: hypothetical protein VFN35_13160 [Ktedonobacteraceae bacterium]|nr:hypothetical protein [Ktedonobacteraceae bacterium]
MYAALILLCVLGLACAGLYCWLGNPSIILVGKIAQQTCPPGSWDLRRRRCRLRAWCDQASVEHGSLEGVADACSHQCEQDEQREQTNEDEHGFSVLEVLPKRGNLRR